MASVMLYFGSFNPIHKGHMAVAEYVLANGLADELWFVVSPQNPLKASADLAPEEDRLRMAEAAIAGSEYRERMAACDVEFGMPRPSYTIDTLELLDRKYPENIFSVLVGGDVPGSFTKWKEWERLMAGYRFYVYPRRGYEAIPDDGPASGFVPLRGAPFFDYSSTDVRNRLASGQSAEGMLPAGVADYIKKHKLWKKE